VDSELKVGSSGIFEVAVNGSVVAKRGMTGFPSEEEILDAVGKALGRSN
jgi:hypothetical protein